MPQNAFSYLALGDSYTIGEGLPIQQSFPFQLAQHLTTSGMEIQKLKVIAQTGWTTGELIQNLAQTELTTKFDIVTLLIGVNNQYRGLEMSVFESEFNQLIEIGMNLLEIPTNLWVISIPDYGQTPFTQNNHLDLNKIQREIDHYNNLIEQTCKDKNINFVDITQLTRQLLTEKENFSELLVADQLHFSEIVYQKWAETVLISICA